MQCDKSSPTRSNHRQNNVEFTLPANTAECDIADEFSTLITKDSQRYSLRKEIADFDNRVRTNGTPSPLAEFSSYDHAQKNDRIENAARIRDAFQRKRLEFFRPLVDSKPMETSQLDSDAALRCMFEKNAALHDSYTASRPSSVVPFANNIASSVVGLPASFSASDVSTKNYAHGLAISSADSTVGGGWRYPSSVFSNSSAEISSLIVEPSISSENIRTWRPDKRIKISLSAASSESSMEPQLGSAMESETLQPHRQYEHESKFEPILSPPTIDTTQNRLSKGNPLTLSCSYNAFGTTGGGTDSRSTCRYVKHSGQHIRTSATAGGQEKPLTYSSTTGYVRSANANSSTHFAHHHSTITCPTLPSSMRHISHHHNGSFSESITGSISSGIATSAFNYAAESADNAISAVMPKAYGNTITYSPSTSFSFAGGGNGGVSGSSVGFGSVARIGADNWSTTGGDDLPLYPFRTADGQPMDLEDVLLLHQPILPPNSHFFCCFYKFHITAVAKVLSIIYAIFYGFLCVLSYKSQHAAAFLIAVLVCFSVGASTIYATFKWSKLCLIPFFLLQIMLILYAVVCVALLAYAQIAGSHSYTFNEFQRHLGGALHLSTKLWITLILVGLIVLALLFCYSALLLWYEYQFIAEVDRFLKSIRRSSSQASRDDIQTQNGANFNSKSVF